MKKSILLTFLATSLFANGDYLPLSKITEKQKLEYNFITLDNNIQAQEVNTKSTIQKDEIVPEKEIPQKISNDLNTNKIIKKDELILKDEVKIEPKKAILVENTNYVKEEELNLDEKETTTFTAQVAFSPITSEISGSGISLSDDSNTFIPQVEIGIDKHKIVAEYFQIKNSFSGTSFDSTIAKLGYRYAFDNLNIGGDVNYSKLELTLQGNDIYQEEVYPSFEMDFNQNIENIQLTYGAGLGRGDDIKYYLNYFINAGIKPYALSDASFVVGYKARTLKYDEENIKVDFKGPYIGVKSSF